jgi:hypothetical protein
MKLLHFLFIVAGFILISQPAHTQNINPKLDTKTWLDNESRIINGYRVTKIFGSAMYDRRAYNSAPLTAVAYKDLTQLKEETRTKAQKENWDEKKLEAKLAELDTVARGGAIEIYISRYNEENANFKWFFVIIRGEDDKGKLWEYELGYQAPQVPYERGWWNYKQVYIPIKTTLPFYIYLNDKHSRNLSDFKFRIEKNTDNQN